MRAILIMVVLSFPASEVWSATADGRMSAFAGGVVLGIFGAAVVLAALVESVK